MGWRVKIKFVKGGYTYIHLENFGDLEWKIGAYPEENIKEILIERQENY